MTTMTDPAAPETNGEAVKSSPVQLPPIPPEGLTLSEWLAREGFRAVSAKKFNLNDSTFMDKPISHDEYTHIMLTGEFTTEVLPEVMAAIDRGETVAPTPTSTEVPQAAAETPAPPPFDPTATLLYRITLTGKAPGTRDVTGTWNDLVNAVASTLYDGPTSGEVSETGKLLTEGSDGNSGWDGKSVVLIFENGSLTVDRVTPDAPTESAPAAGETPPADDKPLPVNTEPKRTLNEWATLDGVEFLNTDGFASETDLNATLLTKSQYESGKIGSATKPITPPAPKPRKSVDARKPVTVSGDTYYRLQKAIKQWEDLDADITSTSEELKRLKKDQEKADALIRQLGRELDNPQPDLFDDVSSEPAKPADFNPNASVGPNPTAAESAATADETVKGIPDAAWRGISVGDLELSDAIKKHLHTKFGKPETDNKGTIGALQDFITRGDSLKDIAGIGDKKATEIKDALAKFWKKIGVDGPPAAGAETPATPADQDTHVEGATAATEAPTDDAAGESAPAAATDAPPPEPSATTNAAALPSTAKTLPEAVKGLAVQLEQRFLFLPGFNPQTHAGAVGNGMDMTIISQVAGEDASKFLFVNTNLDVTPDVTPDRIEEIRKAADALPDAAYEEIAKANGWKPPAK